MPKMHQNNLAAGLRPNPLGSLRALPDLLAAIKRVLLLRGGTFQLTGLRTGQPHGNTRPNGNAEFPIVHTFF